MQAKPDLSTQRTGSIPSETYSPEGSCEKIARLETELQQLGIKRNQFYEALMAFFEALMARRASWQPKESFESPLSVSDRKLEQLNRETDDILGQIRKMTGKPEYSSERKQLFALYMDLQSQQNVLLEEQGDSGVQQQKEYALELEREKQNFQEELECMVQLISDLVVEVKLPGRGPTTDEPTPEPTTSRSTPVEARNDDVLKGKDVQGAVSDSTGHDEQDEQPADLPASEDASATGATPDDDSCESSITVAAETVTEIQEEEPEEPRQDRPGKRKYPSTKRNRGETGPKKRKGAGKLTLEEETKYHFANNPQINGERKIQFSRLSLSANKLPPCKVVQHPRKPDEFYILHCSDHDAWFVTDPFSKAQSHFEDEHRSSQIVSAELLIDTFGIRVLDCTKEMVNRHNSLVAARLESQAQHAEKKQEAEETHAQLQSNQSGVGGLPQDTTSASNIQPQFPPARRSSRNISTGSGPFTRSQERQLIRPVVGKIYRARWSGIEHALVILPFGSFKAIGLDSHICSTGLLERSRLKCHDTDPETKDYIWSKGYEDGGPKEFERKYPVLYFDQPMSSFPRHACYDWVSNSDLRKFDIKDHPKVMFPKTVIQFIEDQKRIGCNINDDDYTDNQGQRTVNTTPSVPCLRLRDRPDSEVEAYFTGEKGNEYSPTAEPGDDEDDSDYEPPDNRHGWRLPSGRNPANKTQKPAGAARIGTGTRPEGIREHTGDTSQTEAAQGEQGGKSTVQQAGTEKNSSTNTSRQQVNSSPARTRTTPVPNTDAASATTHTDDITSAPSHATRGSASPSATSAQQTSQDGESRARRDSSFERNERPIPPLRHQFGTNSSFSQSPLSAEDRIGLDEQKHQRKLPGISSLMREVGR